MPSRKNCKSFWTKNYQTNMDVHYIKPDVDCMNNPTPGYWRCSLHCSDGRVVIGCGPTQDDAIVQATLDKQIVQATLDKQKREDYLDLPEVDRLKILLQGNLLSTEATEAVRIIGSLVITLCDRFGSEPR